MKTLDDFTRTTGLSIEVYLSRVVNFLQKDSPKIQSYYEDIDFKYPESSFEELEYLLKQYLNIIQSLTLFKGSLQNIAFWDIMEMVDDSYCKLLTIKNLPKWLRVSNLRNESENKTYLSLKQSQTLESLSLNTDQTWDEISLQNNLTEEDYTRSGGVVVWVFNNRTIGLNRIQSVVDIISGTSSLGKDISKKIIFQDEDLLSLTPEETFSQSFLLLLEINKGSIPEFYNLGVQKDLIVGRNKKSILFPLLFRQLYTTFSTDDTFQAISCSDISTDEDSVYLEISARGRLNNEVIGTFKI